MTEPTEREMLERLIDGTRRAADRVADVCRAFASVTPVQPRTLIELRHHLKQASGSAHQLGHAQTNPAFFGLRDQLDEVAKNASAAATIRTPKSGLVLTMLGSILDRLWREAERIATSRAVGRQDVLETLDLRQRALVH